MRIFSSLTFLWITALPALSAAQALDIVGIVLDSKSRQPIRHATVMATGWDEVANRQLEPLTVLTTEDGKFRFASLPPDTSYTVHSAKPGYFPDPNDKNRGIKPGATLIFHLQRHIPVTVRVTDTNGLPVAGAVIAIQPEGDAKFSGSFFEAPSGHDGRYRTSLFLKRFRLVVLPPGSGTLLCAQDLTFQPLYYPGTEDVARAEWIDLSSGKEVEIELRVTPVPAHQIHVHLAIADRLLTMSVSSDADGIQGWRFGQVTYDDGSRDVRIAGLPRGTYVLHLDMSSSTMQSQYSKKVVVDDSPVSRIEITLADRKIYSFQ